MEKISWVELLMRAYLYKYGSREEKIAALLPYSCIITDVVCGNYKAAKFRICERNPVLAMNDIANNAETW